MCSIPTNNKARTLSSSDFMGLRLLDLQGLPQRIYLEENPTQAFTMFTSGPSDQWFGSNPYYKASQLLFSWVVKGR